MTYEELRKSFKPMTEEVEKLVGGRKMTPFEECKIAVNELRRKENTLRLQLKRIEQEKQDIVFLLLGKYELLSEDGKRVWEEVQNEINNPK